MPDIPASPKASRLAAPGWLDARLVLGVLLVLVSVVVGARALSTADRSQLVWAATRDLAVGSQLEDGDLEAVRVRLFEQTDLYAGARGAKPVGYVLRQSVGQGEFLPQRSVTTPQQDVDFRYVTVPVDAGHYPPTLQAKQRVDVWVTPERNGQAGPVVSDGKPPAGDGSAPAGDGRAQPGDTGAPPADPSALELRGAQQVLAQVTVMTVPASSRDLVATSAAVPIVLQVRPSDVGKLVSAMSLGRIDVVRVPRDVEASGAVQAPAEAG